MENQQYSDMAKIWEKCRDAVYGQEAIKAKKHSYLPDLRYDGSSIKEDAIYKVKLNLASYDNVPNSTIKKYIDLAMRKPYSFNLFDLKDGDEISRSNKEKELENLVSSCFRSIGKTKDVITMMMREYCITGRFAILIKIPQKFKITPITKAQEDAVKTSFNTDPFFLFFTAEQILNWRENIGDDGYKYLNYIKLKVVDKNNASYLNFSKQDRQAIFYRRIDDIVETATGTVDDDWEEDNENNKLEWVALKGIKQIPIVICGGVNVNYPPLLDLINLSITYFQALSNMLFKQHAVVSDVVVIETKDLLQINGSLGQISNENGECNKMQEQKLNEPGIIMTLDPGKTAHVLNSNAKFDSYEIRLDKIRISMADAGAVGISLNENKAGRETATAYESRVSIQTSNITTMIEVVQYAINDAFEIAGEWVNNQQLIDHPVILNTDLVYTGWQSPKEMAEIYYAGLLSKQSAVEKMFELDLYPESVTPSQELQRLDDDELKKQKQIQAIQQENTDKGASNDNGDAVSY